MLQKIFTKRLQNVHIIMSKSLQKCQNLHKNVKIFTKMSKYLQIFQTPRMHSPRSHGSRTTRN